MRCDYHDDDGAARFYADVARTIEEHGWMVVGVFDETPPLAYTIGLHARGLPELAFRLRLEPRVMGALLNEWARRCIELGRAFDDGEVVKIDGARFGCRAQRLTVTYGRELAIQAHRYYRGQDVHVTQLLAPDAQGRWPDDPRCDPAYREQLS